ncbi:unnamed protein product, partial [Staurois parvus]
WAPVPPPHAAARPVICHGPQYRASSCCCQARNLSWAPVPPPHAAARSRVCHGVPVRPSHCCCLHRHTLPCATFRSPPHTAGGFHFVIGCCMASHLLLPPPPHFGSTLHTLVSGPVTAQMSEVFVR